MLRPRERPPSPRGASNGPAHAVARYTGARASASLARPHFAPFAGIGGGAMLSASTDEVRVAGAQSPPALQTRIGPSAAKSVRRLRGGRVATDSSTGPAPPSTTCRSATRQRCNGCVAASSFATVRPTARHIERSGRVGRNLLQCSGSAVSPARARRRRRTRARPRWHPVPDLLVQDHRRRREAFTRAKRSVSAESCTFFGACPANTA